MNIQEKVNDIINAGACCQELKEKAAAYLAVAEEKKAAAEALIAEIEEDICTIDDAYNFFVSDFAASMFGADQAKGLAAHAQQLKAEGATTCFCDACTAAKVVLDNKELLF